MEETDRRILELLLKDARQSYRHIAKTLGLSVATVASHVERMEKQGIIKGYTVQLDYEKLGYTFPVIIEVKVAHGKLFDVERKIAQDPHVYHILDHTGGTDATVIARFKDRITLDKFVKKVQGYNFVERTETKLILNVIKDSPTLLGNS